MINKRMVTLALVVILCLLFLTGCVDIEAMDQRWMDRAHVSLSESIDESDFEWVYLLGIPCVIFALWALLRSGGPDYVSVIHWMVIGILGVGSFFRILDVISLLGEGLWPEGYTISAVMEWMGWQIPFPEDAVWTSPFAYAFTDFIPSFYNIWQWVLLIVHALMLVVVTFSRNIKPIVVDLTFIFAWAITPSILAAGTKVIATAKQAAPLTITKAALEAGVYVFGGSALMLVIFIIVPCAVGVFALLVPWGKYEYSWGDKDRETKALLKKLTDKYDAREIMALISGFFVQAKPPHRDDGNGYEEASDSSSLPSGDFMEDDFRDPDDFGPPSPVPPKLSDTTPQESAKKAPSPVEGAVGTVDVGDEDSDVFEPKKGKVTQEGISDDTLPVTDEEAESDEFSTKKNNLSDTMRTVGKAAKTVAPIVGTIKPEAGLVLGAAGEVLDREDETDEYPSALRQDSTSGEEAQAEDHKTSDEENDIFSESKRRM